MNRNEAIAAVDHLLELVDFEPAFQVVTERLSANLFAELAGFSSQTYFKECLADTLDAFAAWLNADSSSLFCSDRGTLRTVAEDELKQLRFVITYGDSILELDDNTFTIVPPTAVRSPSLMH